MPRRNNTPLHQPFHFASNCSEKRRFNNEREAQQAADYQMLLKQDLELAVYKCERCGGWHLTNKAKK